MTTPHDDPDFDQDRYSEIFDRVNQAAESAKAVPGMKVDVTFDGVTVVVTPGMSWTELDAATLYLYYKGEIPPTEEESG